MVILFSKRNSKTEKEIIEILMSYGATYISDKYVFLRDKNFAVVSQYKKTNLQFKKGIAVFTDETEQFKNQILPQGTIGICEENNKEAINLFCENKIPAISCGMGAKNTVTLSSLNGDCLLVSLQRKIVQTSGKSIEPAEFRIKLKKDYQPFSVMASATVLLLLGISPDEL